VLPLVLPPRLAPTTTAGEDVVAAKNDSTLDLGFARIGAVRRSLLLLLLQLPLPPMLPPVVPSIIMPVFVCVCISGYCMGDIEIEGMFCLSSTKGRLGKRCDDRCINVFFFPFSFLLEEGGLHLITIRSIVALVKMHTHTANFSSSSSYSFFCLARILVNFTLLPSQQSLCFFPDPLRLAALARYYSYKMGREGTLRVQEGLLLYAIFFCPFSFLVVNIRQKMNGAGGGIKASAARG
jgi:hypothetical protein